MKWITLVFIFNFYCNIYSQAWSFIETKLGSNNASALTETYDHGLVFSVSNFYDFKNLILYKLDIDGNLLWKREYSFKNRYIAAFSIVELTDGGYMLGGETDIIDSNNSADPFLLRLNSCLEPEWFKVFNQDEGYNRIDKIQEYKGDMLVTFMGLINGNNITIAKMDWNGNLIRKRTINEMNYCSIVEGKYGHLNVVGDAGVKGLLSDPNLYMQKSLLIILDSNLNVIKSNYLHLNDTTFFAATYDMCYIDENKQNFLTSTNYRFPNRTTKDIDGSVMITKNHNDNEWNKIISDTMSYNAAPRILKVIENRFFLFSNHFPDPITKPNYYFGINYIIDSNANIIYSKNENQTSNKSESRDAIVTYDGKIVVLGTKSSVGNNTDIYCYKYNPDLTAFQKVNTTKDYDTLCGKPIISETMALPNPEVIRMLKDSFLNSISTVSGVNLPIVLYPNPVNDYAILEGYVNDNLEISILDMHGRLISRQKLIKINNKFKVDLKELKQGNYILIVRLGADYSYIKILKIEL